MKLQRLNWRRMIHTHRYGVQCHTRASYCVVDIKGYLNEQIDTTQQQNVCPWAFLSLKLLRKTQGLKCAAVVLCLTVSLSSLR